MNTNSRLQRKTPLKAKKGLSRTRKAVRRRKLASKGYKPPQWFNAIKPGSHGSTPAQKRLWRVVSETYRKEDWENYGHHCPCCGKHLAHWSEGQLGHWLRYSLCNSFFKYERRNLALICAGCNMKDDAITLKKLGETLQLRHGADILDWIEITNKDYTGQKQEVWMCVDYAAKVAPDLVDNQ